MNRKLDFSKLKFSDKVITTEEALRDVEPWIEDVENRINDIKNGKVSSEESLKSLIKVGILDNEGNLTEPYKLENNSRESIDNK